MALNTLKIKINDENLQVLEAKPKHELNQRLGGSIKKQAFSELKNVLHNQQGITPIKKSNENGGFSKIYSGFKTPRTSVFQDRQNTQFSSSSKMKISQSSSKTINLREAKECQENLFDYLDFPQRRCNNKCNRGINSCNLDNENLKNAEINRLTKNLVFNEKVNKCEPYSFDMTSYSHEDIDIDTLLAIEKKSLAKYATVNDTHCLLKIPDLDDLS